MKNKNKETTMRYRVVVELNTDAIGLSRRIEQSVDDSKVREIYQSIKGSYFVIEFPKSKEEKIELLLEISPVVVSYNLAN